MTFRTGIRIGLLVCIWCIASGSTISAWMIQMPLGDLVKDSAHIVTGTVVDKTSYWSVERGLILTDITLSTDSFLKGSSSRREMVIIHLGGVVGEIGLWQSDTPVFHTGERVLVFLQPVDNRSFRVTGRYQGKFTIEGKRVVEGNVALDEFMQQITKLVKHR